MSIILKGVDLPENFEAVAIITKNTTKSEPLYNSVASYYGSKNIIQIPKGARLIDANKLETHEIVNNPTLRDFAYVYADDIEYAPTILEDEEDCD